MVFMVDGFLRIALSLAALRFYGENMCTVQWKKYSEGNNETSIQMPITEQKREETNFSRNTTRETK
jgi:hypothetical protein